MPTTIMDNITKARQVLCLYQPTIFFPINSDVYR